MGRGYGGGSVYRRGDGYWVGQVEAGRDAHGKRKTRRVVRRTRADVVRALPELRRQAEAGVAPGPSRTVGDYLDWWCENVLPGSEVSASTTDKYRFVIGRYIKPHVGHVRLAKLNPGHVQSMLRKLEQAGLAARTRAQARTVLRRALRWAEQTDLLPRNAAALAQGPRLPRGPDDALDADEARAVLAAAAGDRLEAFAVVALRLGLRRGELAALRWADVDLERGELTIRGGKTAAATRVLPLVAGTDEALSRHRRAQAVEQLAAGPAWRDSGAVFVWEDGRPLSPRSMLRWWHELTERSLGQRRRLHAARHTCATLLLEDDVPLEVVSAILGHAGLSITADIYARVGMDAKRRALSRFASS